MLCDISILFIYLSIFVVFVCTFQLRSREDTCYLSLAGSNEFNDGFFRGCVPFRRDSCHFGASDHPVDATADASTSCHDAQPGVATHRGHNPRSFGDPGLF